MSRHNRKVSVIGLGYVGLPLAVELGKHGPVTGFDVDEKRIEELNKNIDRISLINSDVLEASNVTYSAKYDDLNQADFHIIAVPTPINSTRQPDLDPLVSATKGLAPQLKQNDIVVYESTVYPGLTEEVCIPLLESISGLVNGKDFFVGYSPERINPGDREHTLKNNIKVVSAQDQKTLDIMIEVYETVVEAGIHVAPGIKVAEAAKVIENTQRDLNIALMNELSLIFNLMNIDTQDVLEAAGTKWNFLKFTPGLVGGHCIGVDPYYLTHKAIELNYSPRVILAGRSVNDSMGFYIARMVTKTLIKCGINVKGANVIILGFAFKENVPDIRNTRVIDMVRELESFDMNVQIYDPILDKKDVAKEYNLDISDKDALNICDAIIMAVPHDEIVEGGWSFLRGLLKEGKGVVFDVKSCLPRDRKPDGIVLHRL